MMNKLKFILVGCGMIGKRHASLISQKNTLMAVCDILPERAREFAAKFSCRSYTEISEMIAEENADVLVVCTPNGLHAQHSILALQHGINVLCEKPMAIQLADCLKMISAADAVKKHLLVVKQNRYNPPVSAIKQIFDKGALGKVSSFQLNCFWHRPANYYLDSWHGSKELDGGTLFTQFSHFIDLLYWFLGDVEFVHAIGGNYLHEGTIDFEDAGAVLIKMKNGVIGTMNYNVNTVKRNMEGSFTLFGNKGTVKIGGEYLNRLEYFEVDGMEMPELKSGNPANNYGSHSGSMNNHSEVYDHLEKVLNGEQAPQPDAREAMKTVEIISQIYKKLQLTQ